MAVQGNEQRMQRTVRQATLARLFESESTIEWDGAADEERMMGWASERRNSAEDLPWFRFFSVSSSRSSVEGSAKEGNRLDEGTVPACPGR